MLVTYDDLDWIIEGSPIGSSTPDDHLELSYRATAHCPNCGKEIEGVAQVWSTNGDDSETWVECVEYDPCDCEDEYFSE
jgi:hypothetical protein